MCPPRVRSFRRFKEGDAFRDFLEKIGAYHIDSVQLSKLTIQALHTEATEKALTPRVAPASTSGKLAAELKDVKISVSN